MTKNFIAILTIIFIFAFAIISLNIDENANSSTNENKEISKQVVQETEQEKIQKQNLIKLTNDFALEGKKYGLIKKIDKMCEDNKCIFVFWIDETQYNQLGYEDKQGMKEIIMQYGKLRGEGGVMRGYYSGKLL